MGTRIGLAKVKCPPWWWYWYGEGVNWVWCQKGARRWVLENKDQGLHMPLIWLLRLLREYMFAKILETFCANDIRSCYHQHSLMRPFFFPIKLTPNWDLTFLLVLGQPLEDPAKLRPQPLPSHHYTGDKNLWWHRQGSDIHYQDSHLQGEKKHLLPAKRPGKKP